jgi:hypothetical protein
VSTSNPLVEFLQSIPIAVARLTLAFPAEQLEIPRLRGVWGAALHHLDTRAYASIYKPAEGNDADGDGVPGYVVRQAIQVVSPRAGLLRPSKNPADANSWNDSDPSSTANSVVDFILIGSAVDSFEIAMRAWDMASGMGLGANRQPFPIIDRQMISPGGFPIAWGQFWTLDAVFDYLSDEDATLPTQIVIETPLALQRQRRLIDQPQLVDIIGKTCRRLEMFLPKSLRHPWYDWRRELIEDSRNRYFQPRYTRAPSLHRYSARQDHDFYVPGICGSIMLPGGAGPLLPLLMALTWIHVGKCANVGQGQMSLRFLER